MDYLAIITTDDEAAIGEVKAALRAIEARWCAADGNTDSCIWHPVPLDDPLDDVVRFIHELATEAEKELIELPA